MNEGLLILGMALVTFSVRYPVLAIFGKLKLPDAIFQALRFVPPVVLTAIIVPALVMPEGDRIDLAPTNAHLVAGIAAGLVSWRTRNLLLTILTGMAVFLGWRVLLG